MADPQTPAAPPAPPADPDPGLWGLVRGALADRYTFLLASLLALMTTLPFVRPGTDAAPESRVIDLIFVAILLSSLRAVWLHRAVVVIGVVLALGAMASPDWLPLPDTPLMSLDGELLYFSFSTLTTLGFGDIVPLSPPARVLSSAEVVVGQLFIAIMIARLMGLYVALHFVRRLKDEDDCGHKCCDQGHSYNNDAESDPSRR